MHHLECHKHDVSIRIAVSHFTAQYHQVDLNHELLSQLQQNTIITITITKWPRQSGAPVVPQDSTCMLLANTKNKCFIYHANALPAIIMRCQL